MRRAVRWIGWAVAAAAVPVAILFGVNGAFHTSVPDHPGNTDPRRGWVEMQWPLSKICDGTTLVYTGRLSAMSTVPNSPECAP